MERKIKLHPLAYQEWEDVIDRYNAIKENLGFEVFEEIDIYIQSLKTDALHYQVKYKNIRVAFTRRFHFGIHYIIDNNDIIILSILNAREDFEKNKDRE